jgi:prophage regulatory protein
MATILRLPQVKQLTGKCRTAIYFEMQAGTFPKSIPIGARAVGWDSDEVQAWIDKTLREGKKLRVAS